MEKDLLVICPTRGRLDSCSRMIDSFDKKSSKLVKLIFIIDKDDEYYNEYLHLFKYSGNNFIVRNNEYLSETYNELCTVLCKEYKYYSITCDDFIYHTGDWDRILINKLEINGGGFAYGNDGYCNGQYPSTCIISSNIIKALGWIVLPTLKFLYGDIVWKELGERINKLFYVPEVNIEHMTPLIGKALKDNTHNRTNSPEVYASDQKAFREWKANQMENDVNNIKRILNYD